MARTDSRVAPRGRRRAALAALAVVAATLTAPPVAAAPAAPAGPPTTVIVELAPPPGLAAAPAGPDAGHTAGWSRAADRARDLGRVQQAVATQAVADGIDLTVTQHLTAAYDGFVAQVPAGQLDAVADLPGVRAVHPDRTVTVSLDASVPLVGAPEVWESPGGGAGSTGAGVTVAVIDTGVDYTHPDLGGGFGPGHTVVAGYDFVDDDPDPMDDHGHGTHVAGIVAADGQLRGVAPDATLTAYKVLNSSGNGQISDILAGLDRAVHPDNPHRADVVNLSLSGPGDGTDPLSVAAAQAAAAGVVVVAAAGNHGPGPGTVFSPAAAEDVIAVGASASGIRVPRARMVHPVEEDLRALRHEFSANPPVDPVELAVVDVGRGLPGTYDDVEVTGRAVLMEASGDPRALAHHAQQRGAAAVLFYFPDFWAPTTSGAGSGTVAAGPAGAGPAGAGPAGPGPVGPAVDRSGAIHRDAFPTGIHNVDDGRLDLVALQIPGSAAAVLQQHLPDGPVRVRISGVDATDLIVDFSSRGPTGRFAHKPNLVAPGVEILSTMPGGGYARASGTSMAAPHVAGAAALLLAMRPELAAPDVSALLTTTARRLDGASPLEQGAGRLDVSAAAAAAEATGAGGTGPAVVASPPALSLGLADHAADPLSGTGALTLRNLGSRPVDLTLSAVGLDAAVGAATVTPAEATLAAGEAVEIELRVAATDAAARTDTDLTGWVAVQVDGDRTLSVPFLLSVRHLHLHVTPDPVTTGSPTKVYVRGPAALTTAPRLTVACPGTAPQEPSLVPVTDGLWQGSVEVADAGACQADARVLADNGRGERLLTGGTAFQVASTPTQDRGVSHWQPVGPHAEAGWLAFGDDRHRMAVVSNRWPAVFTSDDLARTWRESRTMPVASGTPASVAVHPDDGDTMVVGVNGGGGVDPTYQGRVLRTTDGGASWDILPGRDSRISQVGLDPGGEVLAVADADGVRLTHDLGATWVDVPGPWSGVQDLHWIGDDLYVASFQGLVRVPDAVAVAAGGAESQREVAFQPGLLGWASRVAGDDRTLLVDAYPFPWLYRSDDGGETFTQVLQTTGISFLRLRLTGDTVYALQPSSRDTGGLWVSTDRGDTWEVWGDPVDAAVEFDLGQWPNPHPSVRDTRYVSSSGAGIYAVEAPGEYERVGIPAAEVLSLALTDGGDGPALVAGTTRDTFRTPVHRRAAVRPDDFEWQSSGGEGFVGAEARFLATSPDDPSVVYKVRGSGFTFDIYRSDDGGDTWDLVARPTGTPSSLLVHPADPDLVLVGYVTLTDAGFVESRDGGQTWRKRAHGRIFEALAGDPTDPDRIWAGDREGLHLSTDGGRNFEQISDVQVTALAVDPADPDRLVIGGRALYTSQDGGVTVERADHVDLPLWISDLQVAADGSGRVYASSTEFFDEIGVVKGGRGVFVSDDWGASWRPFIRGLGNPNVTSLAMTADGSYLYAGTLGGSVHRVKVAGRGGPPGPPGGPAMPW